MASLGSSHGHAYLAYPALAFGMARLLDPAFPASVAREHDALIAAYERRLLASPTGLIETYPGEAYPTDTAAVAGAIAVHGRATGTDHARVLAHWAERVRSRPDRPRERARHPAHGSPRWSRPRRAARLGDGPRRLLRGLRRSRRRARRLAEGLFRHEATFFGFGAIREYAPGHAGPGDVDSGPVVLGVSVSRDGLRARTRARPRLPATRSSASTARRSSSAPPSIVRGPPALPHRRPHRQRACCWRCSPRGRSSRRERRPSSAIARDPVGRDGHRRLVFRRGAALRVRDEHARAPVARRRTPRGRPRTGCDLPGAADGRLLRRPRARLGRAPRCAARCAARKVEASAGLTLTPEPGIRRIQGCAEAFTIPDEIRAPCKASVTRLLRTAVASSAGS